jgi:hypothetical protein
MPVKNGQNALSIAMLQNRSGTVPVLKIANR